MAFANGKSSASAKQSDKTMDGINSAIIGKNGAGEVGTSVGAVQDKVNEYTILAAPVEQALREMQLARTMLRARAEDEINALSPALAVLSEMLDVSTIDLLTADDRAAFLQEAVRRARVPVGEIRQRVLDAGAGAREQLQALGLPQDAA